jgi:uncharacterized membrane protein YgaE (UPF0421/DUF939 family)
MSRLNPNLFRFTSRRWWTSPRLHLAAKAALAAGVAWWLALRLPGPANHYPYYAPLGAVLAMYPTVANSLRQSVQSLLGAVLGIVIALAAVAVDDPDPVSIGLVVAVGVLVAGWRWVRDQGAWIPMAALFVMLVGGRDPGGYVLGYLGQTALGVAVGIVVNLVLMPPLHISAATRSLTDLRDEIAAHLAEMARVLDETWPPARDEWVQRRHRFEPLITKVRSAMAEADDSRRVNLRARRYRREATAQYRRARELEQIAFLVRDVSDILASTAWSERSVLVLDPDLRRPISEALDALVDALHEGGIEGGAARHRAEEKLATVIRRLNEDTRHYRVEEALAASGIVLHLRRCLDALPTGDREPDSAAAVTA